ncbi:response regulator [Paraburkholderia sp. BCC1885]|uniref:response regulator n=1 Tax=Paraburkholderia sp. BCC1885 TaxID=2562669 RepID=UPI00118304A8|nr:response regulator [Paraburkholderia sp. BCC1885]
MIRVLLVDDEPAILEALQLALAEYGLEVHTAANGARALESLALWQPDVVVSDWMMPVMDGGRLARELRHVPALADMPVFLMSALQPPSDLPVDEFLHKPFGVLQLLRLIYRHAPGRPGHVDMRAPGR